MEAVSHSTFFMCWTTWLLCSGSRACVFHNGNASHSTFIVCWYTWLRCSGSPRPHMPEEICVSFFYISNVIVFFCFIKKLGILMFGNFKNISKIDLLIIDELSFNTFNWYNLKHSFRLYRNVQKELVLLYLKISNSQNWLSFLKMKWCLHPS